MNEDPDFSTMTAYQLIDMLNAAYPPLCIGPGEPEWQAHRYAGRRQMIEELVRAKADELDERNS